MRLCLQAGPFTFVVDAHSFIVFAPGFDLYSIGVDERSSASDDSVRFVDSLCRTKLASR
jgi:hypothetical protein